MDIERDGYLCVFSDSPARAAAFFGYVLGETADVVVQDRSDLSGRVLYHVFPRDHDDAGTHR
jgi:hypothetical protein